MDLGQRFDRLHRLAYKHCRAAVGKASYETFDADHRLFCNYLIYGSIDLVPLDVRAALFVVASHLFVRRAVRRAYIHRT